MTMSHLRFGPRPIQSTYLIREAHLRRVPSVRVSRAHRRARAAAAGRDLSPEQSVRPRRGLGPPAAAVQETIIARRSSFHVIDANHGGAETGMGAPDQHDHADLLLRAQRRAAARAGDRGDQARDREDLRQAWRCRRPAELRSRGSDAGPSARMPVPDQVDERRRASPARSPPARPTSCNASPRASWPARAICCLSARSRWMGRSHRARRSGRSATSLLEIPVWDEQLCIQCGKCVLVCPHAAIRAKVYDPGIWTARRRNSNRPSRSGRLCADLRYTLQVAPEDCTGCSLCVQVCPVKDKTDRAQGASTCCPRRCDDRERDQLELLPRAA